MATTPTTPEAAALREAAGLIEEHGWCRGVMYRDSDGGEIPWQDWEPGCPMCTLGAIHLVVRGATSSEARIVFDARVALARHLGMTEVAIGRWNDAPGRTATEVVTQLRAAADRLDREATP